MASDVHLALGSSRKHDVPLFRSIPSVREVLHENQFNLHFDPQLLGSQVVMNIINGIAREGFPCALVPPSLAPEERTLWKINTFECGEMFRA